MKTLKYLSFLLFAFVLSAGFASCSDDDEEEIDPSAIVDTWEAVWDEGYDIYYDDPEYNKEWSNAVSDDPLIFNADGTGYERYVGNGKFSWKLEGNQLTIIKEIIHNEYYLTEIRKVLKLNSSEMILEYSEQKKLYEHYFKTTFKKVE